MPISASSSLIRSCSDEISWLPSTSISLARSTRAQPLGIFAIAARQQLLRLQIVEFDAVVVRKRMTFVDGELKTLGEQRPAVQPVPFPVHFDGDAEFGFALFQIFADLLAVCRAAA